MKKRNLAFIAMMALILACLCACGKNAETDAEAGAAFDAAKANIQSEDAGATETEESVSVEVDKAEAAGVVIERPESGDYTLIRFDNEQLNTIKEGEKELWLRLYKDDSREEGYEISSSDTFWTVSKLGLDGNIFEDYIIEKNGTEWSWVMTASDFWDDIVDCTYYEAIIKDWKNDDNSGMIADGNIEFKQLKEAETEDESAEDGKKADASKAEKSASYWYIDNYFEDASGHGFIFSKPDSKGNPTEVTISGYLEKKENNGTFGFKMLEGQMSPAEYSSDPWIVGTIKGSCDIFKKDELRDSQGRYLYIDVETK